MEGLSAWQGQCTRHHAHQPTLLSGVHAAGWPGRLGATLGLVTVCRGVYHGQEASAEAPDAAALVQEQAGVTRARRTRTKIDPGTGQYTMLVQPLFCAAQDDARVPLHQCDVVSPHLWCL